MPTRVALLGLAAIAPRDQVSPFDASRQFESATARGGVGLFRLGPPRGLVEPERDDRRGPLDFGAVREPIGLNRPPLAGCPARRI